MPFGYPGGNCPSCVIHVCVPLQIPGACPPRIAVCLAPVWPPVTTEGVTRSNPLAFPGERARTCRRSSVGSRDGAHVPEQVRQPTAILIRCRRGRAGRRYARARRRPRRDGARPGANVFGPDQRASGHHRGRTAGRPAALGRGRYSPLGSERSSWHPSGPSGEAGNSSWNTAPPAERVDGVPSSWS